LGPLVREFHSPIGRRWTASLFYLPAPHPPLAGQQPVASTSVLRFQSYDLTLDLDDWPDDWFLLPVEGLVALLRRARIPSHLPLRSRYEVSPPNPDPVRPA
jgi:hypothetical protein